MFLRCSTRKKDGKVHRYWSVVENRRLVSGRVVQRHVLYLGEINDQQQMAWRRSVEVFEDGESVPRTLALVAAERALEQDEKTIVRIRLAQMELRRPRQWGGCWLACELYHHLGLDAFFKQALRPSRKGTRWDLILQTLVFYRLLDPGSEWHLHREWFVRSATWPSCSGPTFRWPKATSSTACTIDSWRKRRLCSLTCNNVGKICSALASRCCSMT